jgi:hypothetical protein
MKLKPKYPMTIAAVNVAVQALSGAIEIAKAEGIDTRMYEAKRDWLLTELRLLEDMVVNAGTGQVIPVEIAKVLADMGDFHRFVARKVRDNEPFEPQINDEAKACRNLARNGVLEHDTSKDRYTVVEAFRPHLGDEE